MTGPARTTRQRSLPLRPAAELRRRRGGLPAGPHTIVFEFVEGDDERRGPARGTNGRRGRPCRRLHSAAFRGDFACSRRSRANSASPERASSGPNRYLEFAPHVPPSARRRGARRGHGPHNDLPGRELPLGPRLPASPTSTRATRASSSWATCDGRTLARPRRARRRLLRPRAAPKVAPLAALGLWPRTADPLGVYPGGDSSLNRVRFWAWAWRISAR